MSLTRCPECDRIKIACVCNLESFERLQEEIQNVIFYMDSPVHLKRILEFARQQRKLMVLRMKLEAQLC